MDIDKIKQTADKTGGTIDSIWNAFFTKGRFWKLLIIAVVAGLAWFIYIVITEPLDETEDEDELTLDETAFIIDDEGYRKGDTIYIDYWSDGTIDEYYKDGETYED